MTYPKRLKVEPFKPQTPAASRNLTIRRERAVTFDWAAVDSVKLKALLHCCNVEGIGVMFSQAQGGRGICLKLYWGRDDKLVDYANDSHEMAFMLDQLIDQLQGSEDVREVIAMGERESLGRHQA